MNKQWSRQCPQCNRKQEYSRRSSMLSAEHKKSLCCSCNKEGEHNPFYGKSHTAETTRKNCEWHKGRKTSIQHRENTSKNNAKYWLGKTRSNQTKDKISARLLGNVVSNETKCKLRLAAVKRIKAQGISRAFNPKACDFINHLNGITGWNLQHATNGGEKEIYGYFVDGYNSQYNIIFEYDEPHHDSKYHRQQDLIRQANILKEANPSLFIRYDEKSKRLYDVVSNQHLQILT